jgi:hypothetical protein
LGIGLLLTAVQTPAASASYSFTILADTAEGSAFQALGVPTINASGQAVFTAFPASGGSGIYRWSDTPTPGLVTIFTDSDASVFSTDFPALAPSGDVFFAYYPSNQVLVGDGTPLGNPSTSIVADGTTPVPLGTDAGPFECNTPRLVGRTTDSLGHALVRCQAITDNLGAFGTGLYFADASGLDRICDATTATDEQLYDICTSRAETSPNGTVAGHGRSFSVPTSGLDLLVRLDPQGTQEILLNPEVTPGYTPFGFLGSQFAVNDSGRVAYIALQESGSQVLVTIEAPAQPVTVIDTNVGSIRALGAISMNSTGDIVFMGGTVLNSSNIGLYTGPNPATDVIVDGFDSLPGYDSPVLFLDFTHPGVNDAGQVVFKAQLQDGTELIARADPETIPTTTTTTIPTSGTCGDPASLTASVPGASALDAVITASDALFILQAGLGLQSCALCVCDVNGSGSITASDALLALMAAIGQSVVLSCPSCG